MILIVLFAGLLLGLGFDIQATVAVASTIGLFAELANRILRLTGRTG